MLPLSLSQSEPEEVAVQTEYTVKLMKYADDSKIKLIKEVKALMEGMNLVQVLITHCTVQLVICEMFIYFHLYYTRLKSLWKVCHK